MSPHSPLRIVCFGDSITAAEEVSIGERWTDLLGRLLPNHSIHNAGRGGATTSTAASEFESQVLPRLPAVVLLQFGFNDSNVREWTKLPRVSLKEYYRNLRMFIDAVSERQGRPIVIRNHLPLRAHCIHGNGLSYNDNFALYDSMLLQLVREQPIGFIDLPEQLSRKGMSSADLLCDDGLHLSREGNVLYASMIFDGLMNLGALAECGTPGAGTPG